MKKWMIRALSLLLIAAFLPMNVLADEYDLSQGSVTVSTSKREDGSTKQDVTHKGSTKEDSNPTISSNGKQTDNTITIKSDAGTTANVTIKDTNIDSVGTDKAAVKTEGKGDVNLNVEGTNTVSSNDWHAGVEKNNEGNLTIDSKSGNGELNAKGGWGAAGIGGSYHADGSNITISGGTITAQGGDCGAGIGGGYEASGSDITISEDANVTAKKSNNSGNSRGGAAIGNGGQYLGGGGEITPDTSGLYTNGSVTRTDPSGNVIDTITGTIEPPPKPVEPPKSKSSTQETEPKREPLYRVLNLDGSDLKHQAKTADGILALTAEADGAILTGTLRALGYLQNQGVEKITFTDGTHNAELVLADLIAKGEPKDVYALTLGTENTLTLNGEAIDF